MGIGEVVERLADLRKVVHRTLHGGADVCEDDGRNVAVNAQRFTQVGVVHLPVPLALEHDIAGVLEAQDFHHGVVGVLTEVADAFRIELARDVEAIHVPLGAAVGDVAPPFVLRRTRKAGEVRKHLALKVVRV